MNKNIQKGNGRERTRDAAKTDKKTPAIVDSGGTRGRAVLDGGLVGFNDNERYEGGGELTPSLVGKDSSHHAPTDSGSSELGGDN
jgi:hypothetical protein